MGWRGKIDANWVKDSQTTDLDRYESYYVIGVRVSTYRITSKLISPYRARSPLGDLIEIFPPFTAIMADCHLTSE